jgi:hypothetical protein
MPLIQNAGNRGGQLILRNLWRLHEWESHLFWAIRPVMHSLLVDLPFAASHIAFPFINRDGA